MPYQIMGKIYDNLYYHIFMMSYENHQHNLLIIIDMTGKFHSNILGKITINKILKKLTC